MGVGSGIVGQASGLGMGFGRGFWVWLRALRQVSGFGFGLWISVLGLEHWIRLAGLV